MTNASDARVRERLSIAIGIERKTIAALGSVARALEPGEARAEVERLRQLLEDHIAAPAVSGVEINDRWTSGSSRREEGGLTQAISSAARGLAAATQAYADLHAVARVLYEPDLCELAERHLADAVGGLRVMAALRPAALARELNAEGLYCRCVCPSCSIGACLCVRSSTDSVAEGWGWPVLPASDGVELRSPPRPGSQLAEAGIHDRDRILTVDGAWVHSNGDMQAALRQHPLGETAQLSVRRSTGEIVDLPVTRVDAW